MLRATFAVLFSLNRYFGGGGDALVYHVLGLFSADAIFGVPGPPLADIIFEWWDDSDSLSAKYSGVVAEIQGGIGQFPYSDTLSIILLHGLVYSLIPSPLAFVLLTSIASSLATAKLVSALRVEGMAKIFLIANPLSIYFAATHLKESICEVLVILLALAAWHEDRKKSALVFALVLAAFRPSYMPVCLTILLARSLWRVDSRLLVVVALALAMSVPGLRWELPQAESGFIFSVVHANAVTENLLGLLVGFGAPYFVPIGKWVPFTYAMWFGGLMYWAIWPRVWLSFVNGDSRPWTWVPILLSALYGFIVVGDIASKTRFYSPILPLMICGWYLCRSERLSLATCGSSEPVAV